MKRSKASLLAWILFAIVTALALFDLVDALANRPAGDSLLSVLADSLVFALLIIEFALLAALIITHQPRNMIDEQIIQTGQDSI